MCSTLFLYNSNALARQNGCNIDQKLVGNESVMTKRNLLIETFVENNLINNISFKIDNAKKNKEQFLRCVQKYGLSPLREKGCFNRLEKVLDGAIESLHTDNKGTYTAIPSWMLDPEVASILHEYDVQKMRQAIERENLNRGTDVNNHIRLMHLKTSIDSLTQHPSRMIIVDPQSSGLIKWLGADEYASRVGLISVDRKTDTWYAMDHDYGSNGGPPHSFIARNAKQNCARCHGAGPIVPTELQLIKTSPDYQKSLRDLKFARKNHTVPTASPLMDSGKKIDRRFMGPLFGPKLSSQEELGLRTDNFFEACLETFAAGKDWLKKATPLEFTKFSDKIRPLMNCAKCHHGSHDYENQPAHILTYPFGLGRPDPKSKFKLSKHLFHSRIREGVMPQDSPLTDSFEKEALIACLRYEYYGGLGLKKSSGVAKDVKGIWELSLLENTCSDVLEKSDSSQPSARETDLPTSQ